VAGREVPVISLADWISNSLPSDLDGRRFAAILGDRPSQYAKSPSIWNPTFKALGLDTVYVPLDVSHGSLGKVVDALRATARFVGGNVTVPYKVEIMSYLDRLDPLAESIGAVNTIARDRMGMLVGHNTDGQGAVDALTKPQPGQPVPFVESLAGARVLLLGAGGAARAVAFYLGRQIGSGGMWLSNRSADRAAELARHLRGAGISAEPLELGAISEVLREITLLVNATSVGQSGLRALADGNKTILEPYSPLAPVSAEVLPGSEPEAFRAWAQAASDGVIDNNRRSAQLLNRLPVSARCFDLVYSPQETTLLRQARLSGHLTLNGKTMNVCQAVAAFFTVMREELGCRGLDSGKTYERVVEVMYSVW
jgi:shikimate dehydrogenase